MAVQIQWRRGTAAEWTAANPLLAQGESGVELDTLKWKVGNGTQPWTTLPYSSGAQGPPGTSAGGNVILPMHGQLFPESAQVGVINRMYLVRCRVSETGSLRGVSYFVTAQSGNCLIAAYDTGQATINVYTKLGDSGSVAVGAANTWQTWDPGAGAIAVTAGQDLMLGVMFDNTTASFARSHNFINVAAAQLPTGSLSTRVLPKLSAFRSFGAFTADPTITEANMGLNTMSVVMLGRVA